MTESGHTSKSPKVLASLLSRHKSLLPSTTGISPVSRQGRPCDPQLQRYLSVDHRSNMSEDLFSSPLWRARGTSRSVSKDVRPYVRQMRPRTSPGFPIQAKPQKSNASALYSSKNGVVRESKGSILPFRSLLVLLSIGLSNPRITNGIHYPKYSPLSTNGMCLLLGLRL
jgi:hypothetical protein